MNYRQVDSFMAELRQQPGIGAKALELAILTVGPSGEVRDADREVIVLIRINSIG
jgi:hypothetical protein